MPETNKTILKLVDLNKAFGGLLAVSKVTLCVERGELRALIGPNGAGKTTLLNLITGTLRATSGQIFFKEKEITHLHSHQISHRGIARTMQITSLFSGLTVFENIWAAVQSRKKFFNPFIRASRWQDVKEKTDSMLELTGLKDKAQLICSELSYGEQRILEMGIALSTEPDLLLLDEPMASIDASLKDDIRRLLRRLNSQGLTIIHVTHDYREAVSLASKVGVIHNGRIIQEGNPDEVFRKPVNKFVARYSGIRNFFRVEFRNEDKYWKAFSNNQLVINLSGHNYPAEGLLILRSDDIKISRKMPEIKAVNCFRGIVKDILPSEYGMEIEVEAGETFYVDISADTFRQQPLKEMSEVWISFSGDAAVALEGSN